MLGMIAVLMLSKLLAASMTTWIFQYDRPAALSMWAFSLPQLAATLPATMTAYQTMNSEGEHLIGEGVVNAVIVLMVVTATLGPILTQQFGRRIASVPAAKAG